MNPSHYNNNGYPPFILPENPTPQQHFNFEPIKQGMNSMYYEVTDFEHKGIL